MMKLIVFFFLAVVSLASAGLLGEGPEVYSAVSTKQVHSPFATSSSSRVQSFNDVTYVAPVVSKAVVAAAPAVAAAPVVAAAPAVAAAPVVAAAPAIAAAPVVAAAPAIAAAPVAYSSYGYGVSGISGISGYSGLSGISGYSAW